MTITVTVQPLYFGCYVVSECMPTVMWGSALFHKPEVKEPLPRGIARQKAVHTDIGMGMCRDMSI